MFIGREKELVLLQQDYIGKAVMVYGKRRVGKTTLIQKALDNCPYQTVYFECLKGTVQENIDSLVDELVRAKILPVAYKMFLPILTRCLRKWLSSLTNTPI